MKALLWVGYLVALGFASGCHSQGAASAPGPSCEEQKAQLTAVLPQLSEESFSSSVQTDLATSEFSGTTSRGVMVEVSEPQVRVAGELIAGETRAERAQNLAAELSKHAATTPVVLAVRYDTDVRTLHDYLEGLRKQTPLRLLFNTPALRDGPSKLVADLDLPDQVLAERDPQKRKRLLSQGYSEYMACPAAQARLRKLEHLPVGERWKRLLAMMRETIPGCACEQLKPDPLRRLLVAEQRAGTVALGSVTAGFLRDWRCRASMPLWTVQQILTDIEKFDTEFSGEWRDDALVFEQVVTDERLLVYMCQAMPGDVLAAMQREVRTLYLRVPGKTACQAWQFEQLARGAPFGTWRRTDQELPALSFHYRQAGNEIRVFGPVTEPASLPTDEAEWACDQEFHLSESDQVSLQLTSGGRWYFEQDACENAPETDALFQGCLSQMATP